MPVAATNSVSTETLVGKFRIVEKTSWAYIKIRGKNYNTPLIGEFTKDTKEPIGDKILQKFPMYKELTQFKREDSLQPEDKVFILLHIPTNNFKRIPVKGERTSLYKWYIIPFTCVEFNATSIILKADENIDYTLDDGHTYITLCNNDDIFTVSPDELLKFINDSSKRLYYTNGALKANHTANSKSVVAAPNPIISSQKNAPIQPPTPIFLHSTSNSINSYLKKNNIELFPPGPADTAQSAGKRRTHKRVQKTKRHKRSKHQRSTRQKRYRHKKRYI